MITKWICTSDQPHISRSQWFCFFEFIIYQNFVSPENLWKWNNEIWVESRKKNSEFRNTKLTEFINLIVWIKYWLICLWFKWEKVILKLFSKWTTLFQRFFFCFFLLFWSLVLSLNICCCFYFFILFIVQLQLAFVSVFCFAVLISSVCECALRFAAKL